MQLVKNEKTAIGC